MTGNKLLVWLPLPIALLCLRADARLIESWSFQRLNDAADVVVVGTMASEQSWPDKLQDKPFDKDLEGRLTTFDIGTTFKGRDAGKQIRVVHYRVKNGVLIEDGPILASFRKEGRHLEIKSLDRPKSSWKVNEETPRYLLFLKKRADGNYEPVSGQIDSALSVRTLSEAEDVLDLTARACGKSGQEQSQLSGEPSWFPLGGEIYHSQDRFAAQGELLAFRPQPRWFVDLSDVPARRMQKDDGTVVYDLDSNSARSPSGGENERKKAAAATASAHDQPSAKTEETKTKETHNGPPLTPPKQLRDLSLSDQGASLSFSLSAADSPGQLRFVLTLKAKERTVWREVEHRWTNTLPLLFAFYADGKAVKRRLTEFGKTGGATQLEEVVEKGQEKTWSLLVDLKSLDAILEDRRPQELAVVAVFAERQHEGYFEPVHKGPGTSSQQQRDTVVYHEVPPAAIVVRSNVVRLKQNAGRWEIVK